MNSVRRAATLYTAARFGLFLLFSLLIWSVAGLAGYEVNGWLLVMLGLLVSSVVGFVLLGHLRDELARAVAQRGEEPVEP